MNTKKEKFVFHWGHGISLFFVIYISYLVCLVFKSRTIDHSLVMDNYYHHDMAYQEHYDKVENASMPGNNMMINQNRNHQQLVFSFENENDVQDVKIHFYRPSDSSQDFVKEYSRVDDSIVVSTESVQKGKWRLKVSWHDGQDHYFKSEEIFISKS